MRFLRFAISIILNITSVSGSLEYFSNGLPAANFNSNPTSNSSAITVVDGTYIVKLKVATNPQRSFHQKAQEVLNYTTRHEYVDESVFLGFSLSLLEDHGNALEILKQLDGVDDVWPVWSIPRPLVTPVANRYGDSGDIGSLRTTQSGFSVVSRASNVTLSHIEGDLRPASALQMSNVDKLHSEGIKGAGIKIAVIDSGVDYRHPSLGGCFGPGCKISFGYDLVGDDYPDVSTPSPDPLTTCADGGHGTHVMGILGMDDAEDVGFGLLGVVPEADLGMYRVFGCTGEADSDVIIAAMLMAAKDGADVISMSLGSLSSDETDDPYSIVTAGLSAKGIAIIVAAGNDGDLGPYSPSSPGIDSTVLSVGSVDNKNFPVTYQLSDSRGRQFRYASVFPIEADPGGLSFIVLGDPDVSEVQMCLEISYRQAALNLTNANTTILAIKSGGDCTSTLKAQVAAEYGFKYVMFYSLDAETTSFLDYYGLEPSEESPATFVVIPDNAGSIMDEVTKNPNYRLFFNATHYVAQSPSQVTGGFMSNFSSFGPTTNLNMKPQLSAPGGNILSTWPLSAGGYAILSGTSMATPFMAGCYALVKSQLPDLGLNETFALLMNTATPLPWFYDKSILSSAVQQGTGLVNPYAALNYESLVTPQQLDVGASGMPVKTSITIQNRSTRSKKYELSHRSAGLVQHEFISDLLNQMYPQYAALSFSPSSVLIQGGTTATVEVIITPPKANPDMQPVYSGFIVVTNNNDVFNIPYVGQPYNISEVNLIADIVPYQLKYAINGSNVHLLEAPGVFSGFQFFTTLNTPDSDRQNFSMSGLNYPGVIFGTTQISDYLRIDVVAANTSFVPNKYGFDPSIIFHDLVYPDLPTTTIIGLDTVTTAIDYGYGPFDRTPIATFKWIDDSLPPADYRLVLRVLRSGGIYEDPDAWDSWLSAIITIE